MTWADVLPRHYDTISLFLGDCDVANWMRASKSTDAGLRACHAAWWLRYRMQYEQWAEYERHIASESEDPKERERCAASVPLHAANWAWACRNWNALGRAPNTTWYEQYRTCITSAAGVRILYAVIDCDTHTFFSWLPHSQYHWRSNSLHESAAFDVGKWLATSERRVFRWEAKRAAAFIGGVPSSEGKEDEHTTMRYMPLTGRAALRKIPFAFSATRIHVRDDLHEPYCDWVEFGQMLRKMGDVLCLAKAGSAFCVHAVAVHGVSYKEAELRALCDHRSAIASHRPHERMDKPVPAPASGGFGGSGGSGGSGEPSEPGDLGEPGTKTLRLTRGACARQDHGVFGDSSRSWPLARNLCGRRVTAIYPLDLYRSEVVRYREAKCHTTGQMRTTLMEYGNVGGVEFREADGTCEIRSRMGGSIDLDQLAQPRSVAVATERQSDVFVVRMFVGIMGAIDRMVAIRGTERVPRCATFRVLDWSLVPLFSKRVSPHVYSWSEDRRRELASSAALDSPLLLSPLTVLETKKTCQDCGHVQFACHQGSSLREVPPAEQAIVCRSMPHAARVPRPDWRRRPPRRPRHRVNPTQTLLVFVVFADRHSSNMRAH